MKLAAAICALGLASPLFANSLTLEVQCGRLPNGEVAGVVINHGSYFSFALPKDFEVSRLESYCQIVKQKTQVLNVVTDKPVEITICQRYHGDKGVSEVSRWTIAVDGSSEYAGSSFLPLPSWESCMDKTFLRYL